MIVALGFIIRSAAASSVWFCRAHSGLGMRNQRFDHCAVGDHKTRNNPIRYMKAITLTLFIAAAIAVSPAACLADENTDRATDVAKSWLEFVDAKEYKKSWEEAAPFFKERVPEKDWIKMVNLARGPFGDVKSRELKSAKYATSLPGAPDGEYVVIQFNTAFRHKAAAVETITPMKDDKGTWRVSGYFIK